MFQTLRWVACGSVEGSRCPTWLGGLVIGVSLSWIAETSIAVEQAATKQEADAQPVVIVDTKMHHLRAGDEREWASFAKEAEGTSLVLEFAATPNSQEATLTLRQIDVRHRWDVLVNKQLIGRLIADENDMFLDLAIPPETLVEGTNRVEIRGPKLDSAVSDDIRVGEISLHRYPLAERRAGRLVRVDVTDAETETRLPCRVTITDPRGVLVPWGRVGDRPVAQRVGVAYIGRATFECTLPDGEYRFYASRGFEYTAAMSEVNLSVDVPDDTNSMPIRSRQNEGSANRPPSPPTPVRESAPPAMMGRSMTPTSPNASPTQIRTTLAEPYPVSMTIQRIVPTGGWIACDTHVHTFTHSKHGDATLDERMLTVAGEGIELPIATDHNVQVDYREAAERMGTTTDFTPVIGNEVTTRRGHYNIFPTRADVAVPDFTQTDWKSLFTDIFSKRGVEVAILNHPRDLHSGFRPFSPKRFQPRSGEFSGSEDLKVNAMEVINSGAVQNDSMLLIRDWFGLMNSGHHWTPVGSSDSHDVSRYIVGQGRTYIRGNDATPSRLDVDAAVRAFKEGKVVVSYGLFADIKVQHRDATAGPGERLTFEAHQPRVLDVTVRLLGPPWSRVETIELYFNGRLVRRQLITFEGDIERSGGVKRHIEWTLNAKELTQDGWLTVVARGPGIAYPFWPTAKPYQATSPNWLPYTLSVTGPIYLDVDPDGRYDSPRATAARLVTASKGDLKKLVLSLSYTDASVAMQAMAILREQGTPPDSPALRAAFTDNPGLSVMMGYQEYQEDWKRWLEHQIDGRE